MIYTNIFGGAYCPEMMDAYPGDREPPIKNHLSTVYTGPIPNKLVSNLCIDTPPPQRGNGQTPITEVGVCQYG
jgi:hypothetical protein